MFNLIKKQDALIDAYDLILSDLDGVVYAGINPIDGAVETFNKIMKEKTLVYITNNASRTVFQVADHLSDIGIQTKSENVVTSPQAAMELAKHIIPPNSKVLLVGGEGLKHELLKAGYEVVLNSDEEPDAVVQGFSPDLAWKDLAEAAYALSDRNPKGQIPWIATNSDWTIPLEKGIAPGNGTLVSAVHTAVGRLPVFAGKPEVAIFETALEKFPANKAIMIGDRLDTDILGANRAKIDSVFVLGGIDTPKSLLAAVIDQRPKYILQNVSELYEPYPIAKARKNKISVGDAKLSLEDQKVKIISEGTSRINLLRAGCELIWGSKMPIYVLDVPEILYEDIFS